MSKPLNIMIRAGADFTALTQAFQQAGIETTTFEKNVNHSLGAIGLAAEGLKVIGEAVIGAFEGIGEFAKEAGELDGRLSSLNRRLGDSAGQFMDWAATQGKAMGLSQKYMIEEGASLSAMLMTQANSQQELANKTETMMKNIAIVSSATGKSQTEVSDMIVSALSGHGAAVRALDLNVMESSLIHTQAFKQIAGNEPWTKLTQQQKEAIMYMELNRQIAEKFGTSVVDDVATRMNQFTSSLSDVKTNLEQAFQPVLYAVLPILTKLIDGLNEALKYVTVFFQTLFNYSGAVIPATTAGLNDQTNAVNNLAAAHAKLSKATGGSTVAGGKKSGTGFAASFDQVHTLPEKTKGSGGSGAGSGVGGIGDIQTPTIKAPDTSQYQANIQKIKDKVKEVWNTVKEDFGKVVDFFQKNAPIIAGAIAAITTALILFNAELIIDTISEGIYTVMTGVMNSVIAIGDGLLALMDILLAPETLIFLAIAVAVGLLVAAFVWMYENWDKVVKFLKDTAAEIKKKFDEFLTWFTAGWEPIGKAIHKIFDPIAKWFYDNVIKPVGDFFTNLWNGIVYYAGVAWQGISGFFSGVFSWFYSNVIKPVSDSFSGFWNGISQWGSDAWNNIKGAFNDAISWFETNVTQPISDKFNAIKDAFSKGLGDGVTAIVNSMIDGINNMIDMINSAISNLPGTSNTTIGHIPRLAKGGITNGAMLAVIGDNAGGREVVTPLDKLHDMMGSTVANAISAALAFQNGNSRSEASGDLVLNIDGRTFARISKPYFDEETKRVGTNVRLKSI